MFLQTLLVFGVPFALAEDVSLESAKQGLTSDDECFEGEEQCALNALQLRQIELEDPDDDGTIGLGPEDDTLGSSYHPSVPDGYLAARCSHRSYCIMGRPSPYMVVSGHGDAVGMESINGGNVGYYDNLMNAAWVALRQLQLCHHHQPQRLPHPEPLPHSLPTPEWLWQIIEVKNGAQSVP